jgi:hypothetical protein
MRVKLLAMFAVLALSTSAYAKDMTGRVGVGADTTLGFAANSSSSSASSFLGGQQSSGISLVYQATQVFGLQLILGTNIISSTADGSDASATDLSVGLRGIMAILSRGDLTVQGIGGLGYNSTSADDDMGMEVFDSSALSIELGIRPEWFVSQHLSFHTMIGISIAILNEDTSGLSDGGTDVNIFGADTLLGSAGFTFYF